MKRKVKALHGTPAPPGFQLWLDGVNGLRAEEPLGLWLLWNDITFSVSQREQKIQELRERAAQWGQAAVDYLFHADIDPPNLGIRLFELVSARETFLAIVNFVSSHPAVDHFEPIPNSLGTALQLVSDHGVLRVEMSPFSKMLDGLDIDRIRLCPICEKLFWAGRRDKAACSELCAGNLRIRRLRQNREYRKKHPTKKMKEKRNG